MIAFALLALTEEESSSPVVYTATKSEEAKVELKKSNVTSDPSYRITKTGAKRHLTLNFEEWKVNNKEK